MTGIFSKEQKIELVQESLTEIGKRIQIVNLVGSDVNCAVATTSRGSKLFVQFYTPYVVAIAIRAIHRIKNKWRGYSYLPNGQGGRNLSTILFNGESAKLRWATVEEYRQGLRNDLPHLSDVEFEQYFTKRTDGPYNPNPNFAKAH